MARLHVGDVVGLPRWGFFNDDCYADAIVATIDDSLPIGEFVAQVAVVYGSPSGLTLAGHQSFNVTTRGMPALRNAIAFGDALAAADFTGDGRDDLAIGVPDWTIPFDGTDRTGGAVVVLRGSPAGLSVTGVELWTQDTPGVPDTDEGNDQFGGTLAARDVTGDGRPDLLIGVPGEAVGGVEGFGAVIVLHGGEDGLTAAGSEWHVGGCTSEDAGRTSCVLTDT